MRRLIVLSALAVLVILLFPTVSLASDAADGLWQDYTELLPPDSGVGSPDDMLSEIGADAVFAELISALGASVSPTAAFFALLMGLSSILALTEGASPLEGAGQRGASCAVSVIASAILLSSLTGLVETVKSGLSALTVFFTGLVPVLSGILAAGGQSAGAATQALNMNITLGIITYIQSELMMPLVSSLFCLSAASGVDGGAVSRIAKGIRSVFLFVSGLITAILAAALAMQSLISSAKDGAYLRAARYAASGMIPVVGSTVSSALATLGGGLSIVRSAVGVGAVTVILGMALTPLVMLLLHRLCMSVSISLLESVGTSQGGVRAFSAIRGALDALIAIYSMTVVSVVLEVVIFLKSGVDVFG